MGENEIKGVAGGASIFTVKNVLRAFSLLCIIFVFCPAFLVSCSGQDVNVSVITAIRGVSQYGEKIVDPHPIMLIAVLLPIAILALLVIKKFADHQTALFVLACSAGDFLVWAIFNASVKRVAKENMCECKITVWFVFNIISLLVIMALTALVIMKKLQMDTDLITYISGGGTRTALNQMSNAVSQMSNTVSQMAGNVVGNIGNKAPKANTIGFCAKCGSPIEYGCKFCTACGTPVPASLLAEAEAARNAAAEAAAQNVAAPVNPAPAVAPEPVQAAPVNPAPYVAPEPVQAAPVNPAPAVAPEPVQAAPVNPAPAVAPEPVQAAPVNPAPAVAPEPVQAAQSEMKQPMFCEVCGAKLIPGAKFCEVCGTKVGS